jgi:regulator of replication initiation timing
LEELLNYLDKFSNEIVIIQISFLAILFAVFIWVWLYNRRRYQHLKHQIPAAVVKNYLDSIIQNSASLKSSLFRGGGMDIDPNGIPSVMPLDNLQGGGQASVGTASAEELNALNAEIAKLRVQLDEKKLQVSDLESKNSDLSGDNKAKQERIEELEALLAKAGEGEGGGISAADHDAVVKERDELKEKLQDYALIEDDIADLKRLKQENAQLKQSLGEGGETAAVAEEAAPVDEAPVSEEPAQEEAVATAEPEAAAEEPSSEAPAAEEVAAAPEAPPEEDKSPEDLLSEFEKMLG